MPRNPICGGRARGARPGLVLALLGAAMAGCGGGSDLTLAPVTGKVTYKGKPLERGAVVFLPMDGTPGPQAAGEIDSGGNYAVVTGGASGAVIGKHKVTVEARAEQSEDAYKKLQIPKLITPTKYANEVETPLTFEVKAGDNRFDIELTD
jgi:hypothetical protein